jgi:hypothetical protein
MHNIAEHRYTDKPSRFYADSVRISKERHENLMQMAYMFGRVFNSQTQCKPYGRGCFHRINRVTIETTVGN